MNQKNFFIGKVINHFKDLITISISEVALKKKVHMDH